MKNKIYFLVFALAIIISSCSNSEQETVAKKSLNSGSSSIGLIDDDRILSAESEPGNWLAYGRTYEEQRFPL
jgi:quinohemoprotein ethanol dehydrogenase